MCLCVCFLLARGCLCRPHSFTGRLAGYLRGGGAPRIQRNPSLDEISKIRNLPPPRPEATEAPTFRPGALLLMWVLGPCHPPWGTESCPLRRLSLRQLHPSLRSVEGLTDRTAAGSGAPWRSCKPGRAAFRPQQGSGRLGNRRFSEVLASLPSRQREKV